MGSRQFAAISVSTEKATYWTVLDRESTAATFANGDSGNGTFQPAITLETGVKGETCIAIADLNAEGKPDRCVSNGYSDTISILLGNGDLRTM
jgi:hypothetical protein